MAVGVIVAAVAGFFFLNALRGDAGGTVLDKQVGTERRCNDRSLTCTHRTCYQISYVSDDGRHKTRCIGRDEFDDIQVGDRYVP